MSNKADLADFRPVRAAVQATSAPSEAVTLAASELQGYLDALPRLLTKRYTVRVSGEWAGALLIRGFYGPGLLDIGGAALGDWTIRGRVSIEDCHLRVTIQALLIQAAEDIAGPNDNVVHAITASDLFLFNVRLEGNGAGVGVLMELGTFGSLSDCVVSNCPTAVMAAGSTVISVFFNSSALGALWKDNQNGAYVYRGGVILLGGYTPELLGGSANVKNGGIIARANGTLL